MDNRNWPQTVLTFWFDELKKKDWFISTPEIDKTITDRFAALHTRLYIENKLPDEPDQNQALASVIVLDQFPRNMYRGSGKAFASDALALQLTKQAMRAKLDADMSTDQKQFLYMPFMHSENLEDQQQGLVLFTELDLGQHAQDHLELIERFGRFPHRNELLGRQSTAEEIDYLIEGKRFGQ